MRPLFQRDQRVGVSPCSLVRYGVIFLRVPLPFYFQNSALLDEDGYCGFWRFVWLKIRRSRG